MSNDEEKCFIKNECAKTIKKGQKMKKITSKKKLYFQKRLKIKFKICTKAYPQ